VNTVDVYGLDSNSAQIVVSNIENRIDTKPDGDGTQDMIFGALWCVGGIIATLADIGYNFWGAIVFGAIQFFRGLSKSL
jgi:hypothetical protein